MTEAPLSEAPWDFSDLDPEIQEAIREITAEEATHSSRILLRMVTDGLEAERLIGRFRNQFKVAVFGSARKDMSTPEGMQAFQLSRRLAAVGCIVINGGGPGVMRAAQIGARQGLLIIRGAREEEVEDLEGSANVQSEIPGEIAPKERQASPNYVILAILPQRQAVMADSADAFAFHAGGLGTFFELGDVLTAIQLGLRNAVPVELIAPPDDPHFWDGHLLALEKMAARETIDPQDVRSVHVCLSEQEAFARIERHRAVYRETVDTIEGGEHVSTAVTYFPVGGLTEEWLTLARSVFQRQGSGAAQLHLVEVDGSQAVQIRKPAGIKGHERRRLNELLPFSTAELKFRLAQPLPEPAPTNNEMRLPYSSPEFAMTPELVRLLDCTLQMPNVQSMVRSAERWFEGERRALALIHENRADLERLMSSTNQRAVASSLGALLTSNTATIRNAQSDSSISDFLEWVQGDASASRPVDPSPPFADLEGAQLNTSDMTLVAELGQCLSDIRGGQQGVSICLRRDEGLSTELSRASQATQELADEVIGDLADQLPESLRKRLSARLEYVPAL